MHARCRSQQGFTLLEVLFALAIIGAAFLGLMLDRLAITDSIDQATRERMLQRLAHQKLQEVIHGTEEETRGTFAGPPPMDWRVEVHNVSSSEASSTEVSFVDCRIIVTYEDELKKEQSFELSTWILPDDEDPILDELPLESTAPAATGGQR